MDNESERDKNEAKALVKTLETTTGKESLEKNKKNPMLLGPVIKCVFQFLKIQDIKNCRLVSREWGSNGKLALAKRAKIHFYKDENSRSSRFRRRPVDFQSRFSNSATLFSAFKISGNFSTFHCMHSLTPEEINKFFDEHQKYIKELTLEFEYSDENLVKKIDLGSWISKFPLVKKDTNYLTKLEIEGYGNNSDIRPLHLIAHIKNLSFSHSRIHVETGVKISPIKLRLEEASFFQEGIKMDRIRINDILDFSNAKEVELRCPSEPFENNTKYVVDLWGNTSLDKLILASCEIMNGERSQWVIKHLTIHSMPCSLNSQMKINELFLSCVGTVDLFTLPNSVQKLALDSVRSPTILTCSQPTELKNLQYLYIPGFRPPGDDYSFLAHFMNSPKLTFLQLDANGVIEINSLWMPKSVQTLTLEHPFISWLGENYWNLEKLIFETEFSTRMAKKLCKAKIRVDDVVMISTFLDMDEDLIGFLEYRKRFSFGKRLYIGELKWAEKELEESVLNGHVDIKSSFYVFENDQKGPKQKKPKTTLYRNILTFLSTEPCDDVLDTQMLI